MRLHQSARDRIAELVIGAAIVAGSWMVVARPAHERRADARADLAAAELEMETWSASNPYDDADAEEAKARFARLASLATPGESGRGAHLRILEAGERAGVEIRRLSPAPETEPTQVGPATFTSRSFDVEATGTFEQVVRFLGSLSRDAPVATCVQFRIGVDRSGSDRLTLGLGVRVGRVDVRGQLLSDASGGDR